MIISKTIQINTNLEHLWKVLTEEEEIKQWMASFVSDEPVSSGEARMGYPSKMKIKEGPKVEGQTANRT